MIIQLHYEQQRRQWKEAKNKADKPQQTNKIKTGKGYQGKDIQVIM